MEAFILPVLVTVAGLCFFIRNIILMRNEDRLKSYIDTSPKAKIWAAKVGPEKTEEMARSYFLPAGVFVSSVLIAAGLWSIFKLL